MSEHASDRALAALERIYDRPQPPVPWRHGGNLPWDDPAFSERMLREHLDQSHGAASRRLPEIRGHIPVMRDWLGLTAGTRLLDVTCGPGLYAAEIASRGVWVTGIDFSTSLHPPRPRAVPGIYPASSSTAMSARWISPAGISTLQSTSTASSRAKARRIARHAQAHPHHAAPRRHAAAGNPGRRQVRQEGRHLVVHRRRRIMGRLTYLHLGERSSDPAHRAAVERFHILNLETGEMQVYGLSDQAYTTERVTEMLQEAGFRQVSVHPAWDRLALKMIRSGWCMWRQRKANSK